MWHFSQATLSCCLPRATGCWNVDAQEPSSWQLVQGPRSACGALWQVWQAPEACSPSWQRRQNAMLAGSTHGLPGTLVCTTWEWQSMHGVPSWCWSWENVTGGGEEPPAGAAEAVAVAPADFSVSGSGTLPPGWQSLAAQVESGMWRVTAIGALTSPVKCTQTSRRAALLAFTNCTAPGLMWQCTQAMSLCFDFSHVAP